MQGLIVFAVIYHLDLVLYAVCGVSLGGINRS